MPKHALMAGVFLMLGCAGSDSPVAPNEPGGPALGLISANHTNLFTTITFEHHLCNGELVVLSGRVHVNTRTAERTGGGFHSITHLTFDLSGHGEFTGDLYYVRAQTHIVDLLKSDGKGEVFTRISREAQRRQGFPIHEVIWLRVHFVEHEDGTRSVDRVESSPQC
jgi:hypothetical protein